MTDFIEVQYRIAKALAANETALAQNLAVYRNSKSKQLLTVLAQTYPVCEKIVGGEFFYAMSCSYVNETISSTPDINEYGAGFPQFIAGFAPVQSLEYLADVAQLEWLLYKLANGKDYQSMDKQKLLEISPEDLEQLQFSLPDNSYLFNSAYPVKEIWEFNQGDQPGFLDLRRLAPAKLFLWRPQWLPIITEVNELEWQILNALSQGKTLAQIGEQFTADDLSTCVAEFITQGWINRFDLD